jgi:hypothetical protein|tara:strand:+ start:388 stop:954 length:567 start_codon:yes stop_codon:yes gene_type:complete
LVLFYTIGKVFIYYFFAIAFVTGALAEVTFAIAGVVAVVGATGVVDTTVLAGGGGRGVLVEVTFALAGVVVAIVGVIGVVDTSVLAGGGGRGAFTFVLAVSCGVSPGAQVKTSYSSYTNENKSIKELHVLFCCSTPATPLVSMDDGLTLLVSYSVVNMNKNKQTTNDITPPIVPKNLFASTIKYRDIK